MKALRLLFALTLLFCFSQAAWAAPQVVGSSLSPASGATGVDPKTLDTIWAQFNDASMDKDSFPGRVSVTNGASFTVARVNSIFGDWVRIDLTADLAYSTTYTVTLDRRIANRDGVQMGSNYSWSFTTKAKPVTDTTPPTVSATDPVASATDVPLTSDIDIIFSEVMDASTVSSGTIKLNNGAVAGTVTVDASGKIATFHPLANLASDTSYTVSVLTGVKDAAGNALTNAYSYSFRTLKVDSTPPSVVVLSPLAGATGVANDATISAIFSEALNAATVTTTSFTVSGGVTGTVSYDPGTWTATFTPSAPLANGTTFTVTLTTAIRDLAGNALATTKSWSFTTQAPTPPPSLNDYCQLPAYVVNGGTGVKPNLLLIVDNSGSMYEFAYKNPAKVVNGYDASYDPTYPYFGYFDNARMYKYNASGYFEPDTAAALNRSSFWSGNFLNWLTMRRIDIVRKVLVGGKTTPRSAKTANFLLGTEDPDRDFNKTYNNVRYTVQAGSSLEVIKDTTNNKTYNVKVYVGDDPPQDGLILGYRDKINFGLMFFNDGYRFESGTNAVKDGGYVSVDLGATGTNLITQIENTDPSTWTPLAETLFEATRYFQGGNSAYNGGSYSGKDPISFPCQKNFVMILTDGESTKDQNLPGGAFAGTEVSDSSLNVKTQMDSIATQEGYASQWDKSANTDEGSYYLEGVAYWAHTTDLRTATLGKSELPGRQNLTVYTVFAFDDSAIGRDILKKTAKYGGFEDFDGSGKPDKNAKWDKNGDGVPDTYFEAQTGSVLAQSLQFAFNDILTRVSSGTAASILSNSEGSGANVLQAIFYPKKYFDSQTSAEWIGELHNMWYYVDPFLNNSTMREDSDYVGGNPTPPHNLNLGSDRVVKFYFNKNQDKTLVQRFRDVKGDGQPDLDSDGNGSADSYSYVDEVDADQVNSIWRAGKLLWARSAARTIYTQTLGTLTSFTGLDTTVASNRALLQAANKTEADKLIAYIAGADQSGYRSRTVNIGGTTGVWRLGDIVASTPRLQSTLRQNAYNVAIPVGYGDTSYGDDRGHTGYIYSAPYQNRGMVYVGANDGMLHAFKLGILEVAGSGDKKAALTGSGLGEEQWAFIPKNALPYLTYLADPAYSHIFYVDGGTSINDVSIGKPADCGGNYWECAKNPDGSTWRSVLIGSMGLGGASKLSGAGCKGTSCVETPIKDPLDASKGVGYSSYFALDVTNPQSPSLLWEFGHPNLGFATTGAALVRVSARKADGVTPDKSKNGRWFAVLASGPTGPIDTGTHQFKGTSNQKLTLYVIDLADGSVAAVIDTLTDGTQLTNAFAGTISSATIDADRWNNNAPGNYQDDALYFGYSQLAGTTWTGGGVLRLSTGESLDPTTWKLSKVIDGTGPVTTSVVRLQDRKNHNLWLYFGAGRYFYNQDDMSSQRRIYGIKEPCYTALDRLDASCTTKKAVTDLTDQSTSIAGTITNQGWFINLEPQNASYGAERLVTDPVALTNGVVFYTSFAPTADVCGYGGNSYLWAAKYDTGGAAATSVLQGKALVQVSTGSFEEVDLATAITDRGGRKMLRAMVGKPPSDPPPVVTKSNLKPVKRILHIMEH